MQFEKVIPVLDKMGIRPPSDTEEFSNWVEQHSFLDILKNSVTGDIPICVSAPTMIIYSLLVPAKFLKEINTEELINWDCSITDTWGYSANTKSIKIYPPYSNSKSKTLRKAKPLTYLRGMRGSNDPAYFEVSQEITHLHDLHYKEEYKSYCKYDENGDLDKPIRTRSSDNDELLLRSNIITFNSDLIDLHLFISQYVLIRLFDSTRTSSDFGGWENNDTEMLNFENDNIFAKFKKQKSGSYLRGFQIIKLRKTKKEMILKLGFDRGVEKRYESFIVDNWRYGRVEEVSCDPKKLGNYSVKSDLPYEISPAFFKPEVLSKYKSDPQKYKLESRHITCRNAWFLQSYDVNEAGQVHTYLKYLSYLPYTEQLYWKSFNEEPKGSISKRAFQTDYLGQYSEPDEVEELKSILNEIEKKHPNFWKCSDKNLMEELHPPFTNSEKEWKLEVTKLNKIIIEGLSKPYLIKKANDINLQIDTKIGSINLIAEILKFRGIPDGIIDSIISPLKEINIIRNKLVDHVQGKEAKGKIQDILKESGSLKNNFIKLIQRCIVLFKYLIKFLESDLL